MKYFFIAIIFLSCVNKHKGNKPVFVHYGNSNDSFLMDTTGKVVYGGGVADDTPYYFDYDTTLIIDTSVFNSPYLYKVDTIELK